MTATIAKIGTLLATAAVALMAIAPAQASPDAPDSTCTYTVVVLSSASCSGGSIVYTCNANNCFVSGTCSVSGTPLIGGLSCSFSLSGTQLRSGETLSGGNSCTAQSTLAINVVLTCGIVHNP